MFSKPWAWFWTVVVGLGSAVAAFAASSEAGLGFGWSIAAGIGALVLCGSLCASYILMRDDSQSRDEDASPDAERPRE